MPDANDLRTAIRDVPDFPKLGIVFKDITPILGNGDLFQTSIRLLAETAQGSHIDKVVGIDARDGRLGLCSLSRPRPHRSDLALAGRECQLHS